MPGFLRFAALVVSTASWVLFAGCATVQSPASIEQFITEQSRQWTDAYVTGNTEVIERILATDFVGTTDKGKRFTKADALAEVKEGPTYFISNKLAVIEVRVHGSTALAFGRDLMKFKADPAVEEIAAWTDTWLLRDGRWQVVASHESKVPLPPRK